MAKNTTLALVALAGLGASSLASGQSSVAVYGVIDGGLERVTDVWSATTPDGKPVTGVNHGNLIGSRFGLRGTEALGGGLSAVFNLESGIAPDTGALLQNGRLFGRKASIGLSGRWGALHLGRQQNTIYDLAPRFDPLAYALYGLQAQDSIFTQRADNSLKYEWKQAALSGSLLFSLGRDALAGNPPGSQSEVAGAGRTGRQLGASLSYTAGPWDIGLAFDKQHGSTVTTQSMADRHLFAALSYKLSESRLFAGYQRRSNDMGAGIQKTNLCWAGAKFPIIQPLTLSVAVLRLDPLDSPDHANTVSASLAYGLSKRTTVYLNLAHVSNGGLSMQGVSSRFQAVAGQSQTGIVSGIAHTF